MRAYSQDLRDKVILAYKSGITVKQELSKRFAICRDTVRDWINRYEETGNYSSKQGVGCGGKCKFTDKQKLLECIALNPDTNGVKIRDMVAPELPMSTFYDTMSRFKITYKKKSRNINSKIKL